MKAMIVVLAMISSAALAKQVSVNDLKKEAQVYAQFLTEAESQSGTCTFTVTESAGDLVLKIETEKSTVALTIPSNAKITMTGKEDQDGSSMHTYELTGGAFQVIHADDAYDEVTVTNLNTTETCGVYY